MNPGQILLDPLHPQCVIHLSEPSEKLEKLQNVALIDTGFDEYLALPKYIAQSLDLVEKSMIEVNLGDGRINVLPVSEVLVQLSDFAQQFLVEVIITEDEEIIVGTKLLQAICEHNQTRMCLDFVNAKLAFEPIS